MKGELFYTLSKLEICMLVLYVNSVRLCSTAGAEGRACREIVPTICLAAVPCPTLRSCGWAESYLTQYSKIEILDKIFTSDSHRPFICSAVSHWRVCLQQCMLLAELKRRGNRKGPPFKSALNANKKYINLFLEMISSRGHLAFVLCLKLRYYFWFLAIGPWKFVFITEITETWTLCRIHTIFNKIIQGLVEKRMLLNFLSFNSVNLSFLKGTMTPDHLLYIGFFSRMNFHRNPYWDKIFLLLKICEDICYWRLILIACVIFI